MIYSGSANISTDMTAFRSSSVFDRDSAIRVIERWIIARFLCGSSFARSAVSDFDTNKASAFICNSWIDRSATTHLLHLIHDRLMDWFPNGDVRGQAV